MVDSPMPKLVSRRANKEGLESSLEFRMEQKFGEGRSRRRNEGGRQNEIYERRGLSVHMRPVS